jgi:hypothetical protein
MNYLFMLKGVAVEGWRGWSVHEGRRRARRGPLEDHFSVHDLCAAAQLTCTATRHRRNERDPPSVSGPGFGLVTSKLRECHAASRLGYSVMRHQQNHAVGHDAKFRIHAQTLLVLMP